ncbi:urease accessory protein UreF [Aestuariirhabdus litorea]|uniref:Urease accessory protein UreF n=1 Tax=Aestuariirhabdus litorea TaxID=2528527 RepID=A0A3P3VUD1_9GAMM|nr:urease accessory protein UreF [Aestuariirhabdus litorea]RRJ84373.1 urease accessory protein UreF [Aestuariirhabdus litorea]RWW97597.1 urease accessory protein UreF [Endozoicomonadaceae bacterium GTF-13]
MTPALLPLLQLVSPALPIGAFAYSQGLEYAIDGGWLTQEGELEAWLSGVMESGLGQVDLPLILRQMRAWRAVDDGALDHWNQWLLANRETRELLQEELQLGGTLSRLLASLELLPAERPLPPEPAYCTLFAIAACHHGIEESDALQGFCWSWLENQVTVACKTLPLGQTAAQRLLQRLMPVIVRTCDTALALEDEAMGGTLPGFAIASGCHETQYSRLFRS